MWQKIVDEIEQSWRLKPRQDAIYVLERLRYVMRRCQTKYDDFERAQRELEVTAATDLDPKAEARRDLRRIWWAMEVCVLVAVLEDLDDTFHFLSEPGRISLNSVQRDGEQGEISAIRSLRIIAQEVSDDPAIDVSALRMEPSFLEAWKRLDALMTSNFTAVEIREATETVGARRRAEISAQAEGARKRRNAR